MLFNKKKRIQYLGFNDVWFTVIGILVLSVVTNYLFNDPSGRNLHYFLQFVIGLQ